MKSLVKLTFSICFLSLTLGCAKYVKNSKDYKKIEKDIKMIEQNNIGYLKSLDAKEVLIDTLKRHNKDLLKRLEALENN